MTAIPHAYVDVVPTVPSTAPPEVVVSNVHKSFGDQRVLMGVDLTIHRGEMVAIVGGSGCGKTVLLKLITGHLRPDAGRVLVADHEAPGSPLRDLADLSDDDMDHLRIHWAVVFQRNALLSGTVYENLALWPTEIKRMSDAQIVPLARKALEDVGLKPDEVMNRSRDALSGGMAKRLAIARALVMDPMLIFYDEPTAGLDPEMSTHIHELIAQTHAAPPSRPTAISSGSAASTHSHRNAEEQALPESTENNTPPTPRGTRDAEPEDEHGERRGDGDDRLVSEERGPSGSVPRTSVIVTHDTELLRRLQPRIVMLNAGTVLFDGSFDEFVQSDHPQIRPYLAQMPTLQAVRRSNY